MSEITRAAIGMPFEMAMGNEMSRRQFHAIAQELLAERDRLRAENSGLQTGYKAYEQVNAELRAEVEELRDGANFRAIQSLRQDCDALRKDAERWRFLMRAEIVGDETPVAGFYVIHEDGAGFGELLCGDEASEAIDYAIAHGEQP